MAKPISASEIDQVKAASIPDEVIEAFNELIQKSWDGYQAIVKQSVVADLAAKKLNVSRQTLFDNHWLDVEKMFKQAGWKVDYDKPGYNEDYEASFTFSKKRAVSR